MKKAILIFNVLLYFSFASAQKEFAVFYGLNISQIYTGSGHGSGYSMNSSIQKGRKSLELGLIYKGDESRIAGGDAKYKIFMGKNALAFSQESSGFHVKPYVHYNCIYHNAMIEDVAYLPVGTKKTISSDPSATHGFISTMEHYTGFGMEMIIAENFCLDGSLGLGAYIGSLDKFGSPGTIGIHKENHGFVLSFEFGMGYKFGN